MVIIVPVGHMGFSGSSASTESAVMEETCIRSLGWEDPLEESMATHSSTLAWRIPMGRGAWLATIQGLTKSQKRLSSLSTAQQNPQGTWNVNSWGSLLAYTANISLTCPQDECVKEHSDLVKNSVTWLFSRCRILEVGSMRGERETREIKRKS